MWFASPAAGLPSRAIMELPPCVETSDVPSALLNRLSAQRNKLRRHLHRTRDKAVIDKNRGVAIPACRVVKPGYKSPDSCDEYPFASTVEGASNSTYDYSVELIPVKDNCSSGSRLGVWYQRHRIRERSPFWVDVIVKGATRPSSGLPGIVVTNPFPDEALDYATCTVDGIGDNIPGPVVP
ncbi:NucA/NucB deoxyribonuclease domain-containing protein [Streptosporangium canum]|uniref:NucA/NucB deoxyribonuclease domain-containing protein n=1 Tax=Streptosporangium canum TaxID=324952 RepID=UPI0034123690